MVPLGKLPHMGRRKIGLGEYILGVLPKDAARFGQHSPLAVWLEQSDPVFPLQFADGDAQAGLGNGDAFRRFAEAAQLCRSAEIAELLKGHRCTSQKLY